jgi:MFS family permease
MGHFSANYLLYFIMSWLPYYLVHERGVSMQFMATVAGLVYVIDSLSAVATGWVTDRRVRSGGDPCTVRKWSMAIGFIIAAGGMIACAAATKNTWLPCLAFVAMGGGIAASGSFAVGQTLAGPERAGRWIGLQNCVANIAGVTGPALTGFLIDRTGSFSAAFILAAGVAVFGALSWTLGVRRAPVIEPVTAAVGI